MTVAERGNIFGTDGIRDRAGSGYLTDESVDRLARALAAFAGRSRARSPRILIGRDSRDSGPEIEARLRVGLTAGGCEVDCGGVLPTPAVSLLVAEDGYDLGIVVSASHNPPDFNGIKVFDRWGRKLDPSDEELISNDYRRALVSDAASVPAPRDEGTSTFHERYLAVLLASFGEDAPLGGMRMVLDCCFGATVPVAAEAFRRAGADVHVLHDEIDGKRINQDCGSLHTGPLADAVRDQGAALGVAFDGDGDRAILIDDAGEEVDGDDMLVLWGLSLKDAGELRGDRVVATVMSNAGMERHLAENDVSLVRTPVGDREVFAALGREGAVLGGEQSGHIIYSPESATGDGIRTGLHMARLVHRSGRRLSELRSVIPRYPQVLLAVDVAEKIPFDELDDVAAARDRAVEALSGHGRVLLRYSGTEPVARVLIEGRDPEENEHWANEIAAAIRARMGVH